MGRWRVVDRDPSEQQIDEVKFAPRRRLSFMIRTSSIVNLPFAPATRLDENAEAGKKGGGIAKKGRLELEQKTGRNVVTNESFLPPAAARKKLNGEQKAESGFRFHHRAQRLRREGSCVRRRRKGFVSRENVQCAIVFVRLRFSRTFAPAGQVRRGRTRILCGRRNRWSAPSTLTCVPFLGAKSPVQLVRCL